MVEKFYYRKSKHVVNLWIFTMFIFLAVFSHFISLSYMAFLGLYGIMYTVKLSVTFI